MYRLGIIDMFSILNVKRIQNIYILTLLKRDPFYGKRVCYAFTIRHYRIYTSIWSLFSGRREKTTDPFT